MIQPRLHFSVNAQSSLAFGGGPIEARLLIDLGPGGGPLGKPPSPLAGFGVGGNTPYPEGVSGVNVDTVSSEVAEDTNEAELGFPSGDSTLIDCVLPCARCPVLGVLGGPVVPKLGERPETGGGGIDPNVDDAGFGVPGKEGGNTADCIPAGEAR